MSNGTDTFGYITKYSMKYVLIPVLICCFFTLHAKTGNMTGTVRNTGGSPVTAATVLILRAADSSLVKTALTNESGAYNADPLPDGTYLVKASVTGYEPAIAGPVTVQGGAAAAPDIVLQDNKKAIGEVTVRAQKPLIEAKADRIIVNVENSIANTGSTALEVLQRSPGVNVDQNDNISLKGKQGVNIMIDGKLVPVQGADLANMLKSMPSNSIEKIELISNPGARYDAAGTAGIINIKTKKDKRMGANGSVTAGYGQGIYPKANAGFNLNYRNKKINLYANYNYAYREGKNELLLYRQFDSNKVYQFAYDQHNYANINSESHWGTLGLDYSLSQKTTLGVVLSGANTRVDLNSENTASVLDDHQQVTSYFNNTTSNSNKYDNYSVNLNLRHVFDTTGRELTVDADYARYNGGNDQHLYTIFKYPDGSPVGNPSRIYGLLNGYTDIRSLKADYVHPLKNNTKIEAGFKTSYVTADNDPAFYDRSTGVDVYDSSRSNHFIYHENINALYVNASKDWTKWSVQLGLRVEQTIADGHQLVNDSRFDRNYAQLFPNLAVTRHLNAQHDLGLTLSRRIDRPTYQQLNPFRNYLDPSSIHEGNPYLNPAFTYVAELSHIYMGRFITQLSYSRTTDAITQVIVPSSTDKVTLITDRNLATNTVYTLSGSYPFQVTKWWNSVNSLAGYYSHFDGNVANTQLNAGTLAFSGSSQNTFTLPKDFSAELMVWYQSPQRYGYMELSAQSAVNIGIQKNLFNKKATAKLGFTDIFFTQNPVGTTDFSGYHEAFIVRRDSRNVNLSFTYRFGKRTVAPARRRTRGAEEELQRAGSNGGA